MATTSNKVFVGNLAYTAKPEDLKEAFTTFGEVIDAKIVNDRATGKSRGFGFVTFENAEAAQAALQMDGKTVHDRKIRVSEARDKDKQ